MNLSPNKFIDIGKGAIETVLLPWIVISGRNRGVLQSNYDKKTVAKGWPTGADFMGYGPTSFQKC